MNTRQKTSAQHCQVARRLGATVGVMGDGYPEDGKTIIQDIGVSKAPQSNCLAAPAGSPSDCSARPAADCRLGQPAGCRLQTAPTSRLPTAPTSRLSTAARPDTDTTPTRRPYPDVIYSVSVPRHSFIKCTRDKETCTSRPHHHGHGAPCPLAPCHYIA